MTRTLSTSALHRIIKSTGWWPADQKPSDLRRELLSAIREYDSRRSLRTNVKAQQARLRAIHVCASELATLLAVDEEKNGVFKNLWDGASPGKVVTKISEVIDASDWLNVPARKIAAEVKGDEGRSDFEWLAGTRLEAVFEDFFRDRVRIYRKRLWGYPAFVSQALAEFGILNDGQPYSSETIIKAITNARSGRRRGGQE
jgi:hypothetical protein